MKKRSISPSTILARSAREIVTPLSEEVSTLNEEAARIVATRLLPRLSEEDSRAWLLRATAVEVGLNRIEGQLVAALAGQPSEIAEHGRVRDLRQAIQAVRRRLT